MKMRGETPEEDIELGLTTGGVVTKVSERSATCDDGWSISIDKCKTKPQVGDTLINFGDIGFPIWGQSVNGVIQWYKSPEEMELDRQKLLKQLEEERYERFLKEKDKLDKDFASLPEPFQKRIERFRKEDPKFRVSSEAYEMICLTDGVVIGEYCKDNNIDVDDFYKLSWEEQKKAGVDEGHSGNTFGAACAMAKLYLKWLDGEEIKV